jgi:MYXO-CTERM domain-containing protein
MRITLPAVRKLVGIQALAAAATGCADPRPVEDIALRADPLMWGGGQKLTAADATEYDQLGYALSLAADRALLGAYGDDSYRGAAYVFVRNGGSFSEEQKLVAGDRAEGDSFGWSVSLDADRALIGAYGEDSYRGAAHIFVRSESAWSEEQALLASDGAEGDSFGWSVSVAGDRALVGAFASDSSSGAAYVFVRSGSAWLEEQKLVANQRERSDQFGYSVALTADRALVGAPGKDGDRGAGYVFVRSGGTWTEERMLVASDGAGGDHLGVSVSLTDDRVIMGACFKDDLRGAAYVFARNDADWTEEQKLVASNGASGHRFGTATSLRSDRALIGASASEAAHGAAYVFLRRGSIWSEEHEFIASDGIESDSFGWAVSLADDRALVGAQAVDNLRGAAYVFSRGLENGGACSADAECSSGHCVEELCCNVDCNGPCNTCAIARGANADGICSAVPQGSEGSPRCDTLACNGQSAECSPCESDADCSEARYCASDQTCQPQRAPGVRCDDRAGEGCLLAGCRSCQSGFCVDRVCCDRECAAAEACTASLKVSGRDGACGEAKAAVNGSYCASGESCTSGHCADGVCCDTSCRGACEACTTALKREGEDGTCGRVAAAPSPDTCEDATSTPGNDGTGCGCRVSRSAEHSRGLWLGAVLGLLLARRRRFSSRPTRTT